MARTIALVLAVLLVAAAIVLSGLLTNWFRYGFSLEATFVVAAAALAVLLVVPLSYLSYTRNSGRLVGVEAGVAVISIVLVLLVHHRAIGGFPYFYSSHNEKSPPAVLETRQGAVRYWIEIDNPFSKQHAEFLVIDGGKEKRIPIKVFGESARGYASAAKAGDWGILTATSDPNVAVLTLGPNLSPSGDRFRVDLTAETATKIPNT